MSIQYDLDDSELGFIGVLGRENRWEKKYFRLRSGQLEFFDSEDVSQPRKGVVILEGSTLIHVPFDKFKADNVLAFKLAAGGAYVIRCDSDQHGQTIIDCVLSMVDYRGNPFQKQGGGGGGAQQSKPRSEGTMNTCLAHAMVEVGVSHDIEAVVNEYEAPPARVGKTQVGQLWVLKGPKKWLPHYFELVVASNMNAKLVCYKNEKSRNKASLGDFPLAGAELVKLPPKKYNRNHVLGIQLYSGEGALIIGCSSKAHCRKLIRRLRGLCSYTDKSHEDGDESASDGDDSDLDAIEGFDELVSIMIAKGIDKPQADEVVSTYKRDLKAARGGEESDDSGSDVSDVSDVSDSEPDTASDEEEEVDDAKKQAKAKRRQERAARKQKKKDAKLEKKREKKRQKKADKKAEKKAKKKARRKAGKHSCCYNVLCFPVKVICFPFKMIGKCCKCVFPCFKACPC